MRIYGVEFSGPPGFEAPITCAVCELKGTQLTLDCFVELDGPEVFENLLASDGPWVAGFAFPFGLPAALVRALGWPAAWPEYVAEAARHEAQALRAEVTSALGRLGGEDGPALRATDRAAGVTEPPGVDDVLRFAAGAPRLLAAGVNVIPCRPNGEWRIAVEASPGLVAEHLAGNGCCAGEAAGGVRREIVTCLAHEALAPRYGLGVALAPAIAQDLGADPAAANLQALLASVQAAWAYGARERDFRDTLAVARDEGWISDPALLETP